MEEKTFIEASCIYETHWRKHFLQLLLLKACESFKLGQIKKPEADFGMHESSLLLWKRKDQINTIYVK